MTNVQINPSLDILDKSITPAIDARQKLSRIKYGELDWPASWCGLNPSDQDLCYICRS
ncbi:MAG: hypothetical protein WBZ36_00840 [Candidatus Nitrosopolaris sp.]